jgi:hypothetical protein
MDPVSRRSFLVQGAAAAAGVTGAAVIGIHSAPKAGAETELSDEEILAAAGPMLLRVHDVATGEVELLIENRSVLFTDKPLVAKVLRATR